MSYSVEITWREKSGNVITVGTNSTRIDAVSADIANKGGTVIKVTGPPPSKNVPSTSTSKVEGGKTVFYEANPPVSKEPEKANITTPTGYPTKIAKEESISTEIEKKQIQIPKTSPTPSDVMRILSGNGKRLDYQTEQIVKTKMTEAPINVPIYGRREWAIKQLEKENILEEGYSKITTIPSAREVKTTGYEAYGYSTEKTPYWQTYSQLQSNIAISEQNILASQQAKKDIPEIEKRLTEAKTELTELYKYREQERDKPVRGKVTITEEGVTKEVSIREAIEKYEGYTKSLEESLQSSKDISTRDIEFMNIKKRTESDIATIKEYEKAGYILETGAEGEMSFRSPKASEVVEQIYGYRPDLYTAQSMRSLGLGTLVAGAQELITGDKKVKEAEKERLAEGILGSTRRVGESAESFTARFWTSPEVIADIYIPIATLGVGAAISTGTKVIGATATGAKAAGLIGKSPILSGAAKILGSTTGQVTIVGGMIVAQEAPVIIETALTRPEVLGSTIGRGAYDIGMGLGSFTVGLQAGEIIGARAAPTLMAGYGKAVGVVREELPLLYRTGEKAITSVQAFKTAGMETNRELYGRLATDIKSFFRETGAKEIMAEAQAKGLPIRSETIYAEEQPIKAISQTREGVKVSYDVKTGEFTKERIPVKTTEGPWTKEWEFKPPEKTVKTGREVIAKQEPWSVDVEKKYEIKIKGETKQRRPEDEGRALIYREQESIYAPEKGEYFLGQRDVVKTAQLEPLTKAEIMKSKSGKTPFKYKALTPEEQATPKWMRRDRPPSPETWEKFTATKKDVLEEDWQNALVEKKWRETKSGDVGVLKEYQIVGDKIVRVGGEQGIIKPSVQSKILKVDKEGIIFGKGKSSLKPSIETERIEIPITEQQVPKWEFESKPKTIKDDYKFKTLTPEEQATPKWMRRDRPPSPETWEKFTATKKDVLEEDWQNALVEKKWRETKSGDVGVLKEYEIVGDKVVRTGKPKESFTQRLDIKYEQPKFVKEGTIAGGKITPGEYETVGGKIRRVGDITKPSRETPFKFPKQEPSTPKEITGKGITGETILLEKPAKLKPSKVKPSEYEGAEYKGELETINRPLTEQEVKILSEAEEGVYVQRRGYVPIVRPDFSISTKPSQAIRYDIKTGLSEKLERKEIEGTKEIEGLKFGEIQREETKQELGYMPGIRQIQRQEVSQAQVLKPAQKQIQRLRQEQMQEQTLKLKTKDITREEEPSRIKKPRRILILDIGKEEPSFKKAKKSGRDKLGMPKIKPGIKDKGLLADWLSVTQSQARYGKATQPVLSRRVWSEAAKTGFRRVPTTEMRVGGNKRNVFGNKKGGRNVYI